jgi:hypothetical protein
MWGDKMNTELINWLELVWEALSVEDETTRGAMLDKANSLLAQATYSDTKPRHCAA